MQTIWRMELQCGQISSVLHNVLGNFFTHVLASDSVSRRVLVSFMTALEVSESDKEDENAGSPGSVVMTGLGLFEN